MSDWGDGLDEFGKQVEEIPRAVFLGTVAHAQKSIVFGSPVTGAPGQPVDEGDLQRSWGTVFPSPDVAEISTNKVYAPGIEDGVSMKTGLPLTLRSSVGGFHSVKLTEAGLPAIVAHELRLAKGGG